MNLFVLKLHNAHANQLILTQLYMFKMSILCGKVQISVLSGLKPFQILLSLDLLIIQKKKITVTAPLMDAASNQKLLFWGSDYHIKNA